MTDHRRVLLVTRGDDMGAFQAGNLAIMDAFRNGILRNASIMVSAPYAQQAAALVKHEHDLCLGLHITLTSEWDTPRWGPVSSPDAVPSLLDRDGCFFRTPMELYEREVRIEEMMREVRAQLERARALGLDIRYIDEHMGVGWLLSPPAERRLSDALRELSQQEGLLWHKDVPLKFLACTSAAELQQTLQELTAGSYLLITHPAYESEEMRKVVGYSAPVVGQIARVRENDYRMLCHPEVLKTIQEKAIAVLRYDECG